MFFMAISWELRRILFRSYSTRAHEFRPSLLYHFNALHQTGTSAEARGSDPREKEIERPSGAAANVPTADSGPMSPEQEDLLPGHK
jgi:hypothetical protein